jgi:uncharacterized membrane protein YraQ (UPF0718 family)
MHYHNQQVMFAGTSLPIHPVEWLHALAAPIARLLTAPLPRSAGTQWLEDWIAELIAVAVLLHVVTFVLAWVRHRLGTGWLQRSLGRRDIVGLLSGAGLGLFTPVCSCGVGAVYASLLQNGASPPAAAAFLFAAPAINEFVLLLILVMLGPIGALLYVLAGLGAAVLAGRFAERLHLTPFQLEDPHHHDHEHAPAIPRTPVQRALHDTFDLTRRLALPLAIATACVALLQLLPVNPIGFITSIGHAWFAPIVAALVGLPLHIETPLLGSVFLPLVKIGLPLGTVISLLMATTVATVPEAVVLRRIVGWRGVWSVTSWFFLYTAMVGLLINAIGRMHP